MMVTPTLYDSILDSRLRYKLTQTGHTPEEVEALITEGGVEIQQLKASIDASLCEDLQISNTDEVTEIISLRIQNGRCTREDMWRLDFVASVALGRWTRYADELQTKWVKDVA